MTSYVFYSLGLVFVLPLAVLLTPSFRGLFVHVGLTAFFHAMGALALSLALDLLRGGIPVWAVGFSAISAILYLSATMLIVRANHHRKDASGMVIEQLMRRHPEERILLQAKRILWPLVLFPASRGGSYARSFSGRRWIARIKAGFGFSKLYLTDKHLLAQLMFPPVLIITIDRQHLRSAGYVDHERDVIGIRYSGARMSPMTKLLAFSGTPANRDLLFLNLGAESGRWLAALTAGEA